MLFQLTLISVPLLLLNVKGKLKNWIRSSSIVVLSMHDKNSRLRPQFPFFYYDSSLSFYYRLQVNNMYDVQCHAKEPSTYINFKLY
ncbi:hypothetical protein BDC45DRAFT_496134 [Circinella umbellata]|nr:hypothetical protein BDC45DRAFT_496134 [Circinella umbellata]